MYVCCVSQGDWVHRVPSDRPSSTDYRNTGPVMVPRHNRSWILPGVFSLAVGPSLFARGSRTSGRYQRKSFSLPCSVQVPHLLVRTARFPYTLLLSDRVTPRVGYPVRLWNSSFRPRTSPTFTTGVSPCISSVSFLLPRDLCSLYFPWVFSDRQICTRFRKWKIHDWWPKVVDQTKNYITQNVTTLLSLLLSKLVHFG